MAIKAALKIDFMAWNYFALKFISFYMFLFSSWSTLAASSFFLRFSPRCICMKWVNFRMRQNCRHKRAPIDAIWNIHACKGCWNWKINEEKLLVTSKTVNDLLKKYLNALHADELDCWRLLNFSLFFFMHALLFLHFCDCEGKKKLNELNYNIKFFYFYFHLLWFVWFFCVLNDIWNYFRMFGLFLNVLE